MFTLREQQQEMNRSTARIPEFARVQMKRSAGEDSGTIWAEVNQPFWKLYRAITRFAAHLADAWTDCDICHPKGAKPIGSCIQRLHGVFVNFAALL